MKVLDRGHDYVIDTYDGSEDEIRQRIRFMKRHGDGFPGNIGSNPGTNCQELLRVLIDRVKYLDNQIHSNRNDTILGCLRTALVMFEVRAAERHGINTGAGVWQREEDQPEEMPTCPICGHFVDLVCKGH